MEELRKQVRRVQWWLGWQRFLGVLGWCWFATLTLGVIAAALVSYLYGELGIDAWLWGGTGAVGLGLLAALIVTLLGRRSPLEAAIELDRRFELKERVSSTLAMTPEERETDIGQALIADAARRVERVDVGERFTVSPGRQILLPLVPAVLAIVVALFVHPAVIDTPADAKTEDEAAKKQIEQSGQTLRRKLEEQRKRAQEEGLKDAQNLLRRLEEETKDLAAKQQDRKQAMIKLNDLAQQLEKRQKQLGGADQVQKQLNKLKDVGKGPAEKFLSAVAKGDIKKAIKELEKLRDDLANDRLDPQQREELANQLDRMREKIEKMVAEQRQAEEDLQKRIEQAKANQQEDEVKRLQEQLDQLQQKSAQRDRLQQLAQKLGQCSKCLQEGQTGEAGDRLADLEKDLQGLQGQMEEFEMLEDAKNDLAKARAEIGGEGCRGAGMGDCDGDPKSGMGRGRGIGERPEEANDVDFYETRAVVKTGRGAASIVGETDGPNVKGNVQQKLSQQFQAAKQQATDPLTNERIPRKQRQHAQQYFDRLREGR